MLMKEFVDKYFHEGLRYKEIIALLKNRHGIKVNLRTLRHFLRRENFYRKGKQSPLLEIVTFIQNELAGSDSCIGYRAMDQNGFMVSRVIVAQVIKHIDPIGVNTRRRGTLRYRSY